MYELINLPKIELGALLQEVSGVKGLSRAIVKKDLWVCVVLDYLFTKSPWKNNLAFKGGTSLSKAYNLIERFSEDIDLILDWRVLGYGKAEPFLERSANQQDRLNKEILKKTSEFLQATFIPKLKQDLRELIDYNLEITFEDDAIVIGYGNNYIDNSILQTIRLEIGALAAWTPTQTVTIRPYIAEAYPEQFSDAFVDVRTTTPERTFWEKITILHREAFRPENIPIPPRMSRHYYDIDRMAKLGVLNKALAQKDLLTQVADFKAKFYPQKWAHYDLAKIDTLCLMPPEYNLKSLGRDYNAMAGMIYGEKSDFGKLLEEIAEIEWQINNQRGK